MPNEFDLGLNIQFGEGDDPTEDQIDSIAHAIIALQTATERAGSGMEFAFSGASQSVNDLENSLVGAGSKLESALLNQLNSAFADAIAGTDALEDELVTLTPVIEEQAAVVDKATNQWRRFAVRTIRVRDSLIEFGQEAKKATDWLEGFDLAIGSSGSTSLLQFEAATQQAAVNLGMGGDRARYMSSEILSLSAATQFSVGEITQLAIGLSEAGAGLDQFGKATQKTMISLVEVFGLSGQEIARTAKLTSIFGGSIDDLSNEAAVFQKTFGIPGIFKELPGITEFALDATLRFGTEVVGSGKDVTSAIINMSGVFSKALGKTIPEAIDDARSHFESLAGNVRQFKDVFLGLESDFDPTTKALMEIGRPLFSIQKLFKDTTDDPLAFASSIRQMRKNIGPGFMDDRFMRQLERTLPKATFALISNIKVYQAAVEERNNADARSNLVIGKSEKAFAELTKTSLDTVQAMKDMFGNVKGLAIAMLRQTGLTDALKNAFKGAKDTFVKFSKSIQVFVESEEFQVWAERLKPILAGVGKAVLLVGTAFGGLGAALASLKAGGVALRTFGSVAKGTGKSVGKLANFLGVDGRLTKGLGPFMKRVLGSGSAFRVFGKRVLKAVPVIGTAVSAIDGIRVAFSDMGEIVGDPNASGMEKFQAVLQGTIKGVGTFFDNVLLGIPGMILNKFFPGLEQSFDEGFDGLFSSVSQFDVGEAIGVLFNQMTSWFQKKFVNLGDTMAKMLPDWKVTFKKWGSFIGGAIGGLGKMLMEGLVWVVSNLNPISMIISVVKFFKTVFTEGFSTAMGQSDDALIGAFANIMKSIGSVAKEFTVGLVDGMLGAWGTSIKEMAVGAQITFESIKIAAVSTVEAMMSKFIFFKSMINSMWDLISLSGANAWNVMQLGGLKAVSALSASFMGPDGFITTVLTGLEKLLVAMSGLPFIGDKLQAAAIKLGSFRKEMVGFDAEGQAQIKTLEDRILKDSGLTEMWANAKKKAADESEKGVASLTASRVEMEATRDALSENLKSLADERRLKGKHATAAREWRKEEKTGLAEQLQSALALGAGFKSLNAQAGDEAAKSLTRFMDKTIRALSDQVSAGKLSTVEASKKMDEAQKVNIKKAITGAQAGMDKETGRGETASATAKRAGGARGANEFMIQRMNALTKAMTGAARQSSVRVDVAFRGAGHAVDKHLGRRSEAQSVETGS